MKNNNHAAQKSLRLALAVAGMCAIPSFASAAVTFTFNPTSLNFPVTTTGTTSAALTITVTNTGTTAGAITSIVLSGSNAADFKISANTCGSSLAAGANCVVSTTFKPLAGGIRQAGVTFTDAATGSPQTVPISGTGQSATAGIGFFPTSISFPATTVGFTSSAIGITVTNYATTTVTFSGIHLQGTNAGEFTISGNGCSSLTQGQACSVNVTFTPLAPGIRQASLAFTDTATGSPQVVPIIGTAQKATQTITVAPTSLGFGALTLGTPSGSSYVGFTNSGTATVTMTSYSITGADAADFAITNNGCPTPGGLLNAASTCYIYVAFTPSAKGVRTAALSVADSATGSPQTATLYGVGQTVVNSLSFSQGTIDLGVEPIGSTSGQTYVVATNTGTANVTFTSVALGGTNPGDFSITSNGCSSTLTPFQTCAVYVNFTPTAAGQRNATLTFTDSATGSPQAVNIVGSGETQTETLAFNYLDYSFGQLAVGATSNANYFSVLNVGDDPLAFSNIAIAGANAADFTITSNGCPGTGSFLTNGQVCYVYVAFSPAAAGVRTASLVFTDTATGSPQSIGLGGLGLADVQTLTFGVPHLVFPGIAVGSSTSAEYVAVTNTGDQMVTFNSVTVTGANASSFSISSNGCTTLAPASTCYVYAVSTPLSSSVLSAALSFNDTATGSPQSIPLVGDGEPASPPLTPGVADIDFGTQITGVSSASTLVNVSNTSGSTATIAFHVIGPNPADFPVTNNTCTGSLGAGSSCSLKVAFDPAGLGNRTAALNFVVGASSQDVLISGVGVPSSSLLTLPPAVDLGTVTLGTSSAQTAIPVLNSGSQTVNITSYTVTGTNPADFAVASNTCGASLIAGASCNVNVLFTPTAANERTASLQIADSATGSPQAVGLSGTGQTSLLTLSLPASLDLGASTPGVPVSVNLTVYNSGTGVVTINRTAISGANAADFAVTYNPCSTINPDSSCNIQVTFNPTASGVRTATLSLTDTATGSPQSVTLVGAGQPTVKILNVPSALAFPSSIVGTFNLINMYIQNIGSASITVSSVAITGTNAADFATYNACTQIGPNQGCYLPIGFTPSAAGLRVATVTITSSATGSPQTVALTGVGQAAILTLSLPPALAFPAVTTGTYLVESFPMYNTGDQTIVFSSATIAGANATDFQVLGNCPQLTPGQGCTVYVAFTPTAAGTRTAALAFTDNGTGSPQAVSLTGIGQARTTTAALYPSALSFGTQTVGTQSNVQNVFLTNYGAVPVKVTSVTMAGTNPADYQVYYNACTGVTLNQNVYCLMQVSFAPKATGSRTATLQVNDNAFGGPQTATLTGTGN